MRYDKKIIAKACGLYVKGVSLRKIQAETDIKSTSTILFACNPRYREGMKKRHAEWRKKNPERWTEICQRAHAKRKAKGRI